MTERLLVGVEQVHSSCCRNVAQLSGGGVLVVGTGRSGCRTAEDLYRAGR
ncbi:hypothetical protein [Streptomyces sp. NPDC002276]